MYACTLCAAKKKALKACMIRLFYQIILSLRQSRELWLSRLHSLLLLCSAKHNKGTQIIYWWPWDVVIVVNLQHNHQFCLLYIRNLILSAGWCVCVCVFGVSVRYECVNALLLQWQYNTQRWAGRECSCVRTFVRSVCSACVPTNHQFDFKFRTIAIVQCENIIVVAVGAHSTAKP